MKRLDVVVLVGLLLATGLTLPAVLQAQSERANRTKCANNLRQLALAAIQYADDKRFFPHIGKLTHLDGDIHTPDTPKTIRTLLWYGYHDDPERYICPSSDDMPLEIRDSEIREKMRLWSWDRKRGESDRLSPIVQTKSDPKLSETTELSYGWTRKGMNTNVRSTAILSADRAVRDGRDTSALRGNHDDGWNVLRADATVSFSPLVAKVPVGDTVNGWLISTQRSGGYLSCKAQPKAAAMGRVDARPATTPWAGGFAGGGDELRLAPRAWSERESTWSFRGTLKRGGKSWPVWGRVDKSSKALKGVVDGEGGQEKLAVIVEGDGVQMTVGAASRALKRTAASKASAADYRLREGVARAFLSAVDTKNQAAAEALLTKQSVEALAERPDWFANLRKNAQRMERREELIANLAVKVRESDGTLKVALMEKMPRPKRERPSVIIGTLKTISIAQSLFREADKEADNQLDYAANLRELIDTGLVDKGVEHGTADGYKIVVCSGSAAPEFLWMAVAKPRSGDPWYAVNHEGVIYTSKTEIKLDTKDCKIRGGTPVGR